MSYLVNPYDDPYVRILFYGTAGATKTRTVSTAAWDERTAPALMLETGGNPISIRDYEKIPTIVKLETVGDLNAPYDWFHRGQPANHPFAKKFGLELGYKSIIIDSLTDLQRLVIDETTNRTDVAPGDPVAALGLQGFGQILARVLHMTRLYFGLPVHVFITCLESEHAGVLKPLLWGQARDEVPGYGYVVGRLAHRDDLPPKIKVVLKGELESAKSAYIALFSKQSQYYAKDQYGVLGHYLVDPTIGKIMDLIQPNGGA